MKCVSGRLWGWGAWVDPSQLPVTHQEGGWLWEMCLLKFEEWFGVGGEWVHVGGSGTEGQKDLLRGWSSLWGRNERGLNRWCKSNRIPVPAAMTWGDWRHSFLHYCCRLHSWRQELFKRNVLPDWRESDPVTLGEHMETNPVWPVNWGLLN